MEQLILHLFGDYILQSDWMAQNKTRSTSACLLHAYLYSLPFILLTWHLPGDRGPWAWFVIGWSHFFIDRFGLARYVCWTKNFLAPKGSVPPRWDGQGQQAYPRRYWDFASCRATGYAPDRPAFLAVWLLIITDNTLHLAINYAALRWL